MQIFRRLLPALSVLLLVAHSAVADIVIDDFSVNQSLTYSVAQEPFFVADHNADHPGIFGGERNLRIGGSNVNGGSVTIQIAGGTMTWHRPTPSRAKLAAFWDGDNDSTTFDPDFGAAVDLTAGGTLNTFRIGTISSTHNATSVRFDVYSSSTNKSWSAFNVPTNGGNVDLRMDQFIVSGGTGADFTAVRAISMEVYYEFDTVSFDMVFDSVSVVATKRTERQIGPNDFLLSTPGLTLVDAEQTRESGIAGNGGTEALFVWRQQSKINPADSDPQVEIWGRRFNTSTGAAIGAPLRISTTGGDIPGFNAYQSTEPDVTYNATSNEYLVVWRGKDNVIAPEEFEIFGRRIDASTGAALGPQFRISSMGVDGVTTPYVDTPSIAWDSINNRYLAVWVSNDVQGNEVEVYARILNSDGSSFSADDLRLSSVGPDLMTNRAAENPDVAFDPAFGNGTGRFLVVFSGDYDANNATDIFGQFVNPDGSEGGADFRISDMGDDPNSTTFGAALPKVVFNPTEGEFLVVWTGTDNVPGAGLGEIFGQRIDAASGADVGTNDFQISDVGPIGETTQRAISPDVDWNAATNTYAVSYTGDDVIDERQDVLIQRVTASGTRIGDPNFRVSDTGVGAFSGIVFPDRIAIAWTGLPNEESAEPGAFAQLVELLTPSGATTTITASPTSIVANGTSTSTITVQAKLADGNDVPSGGATVLLQSSLGTIGAITDAGNGTYTAVLTSSMTIGTATITGSIDGTSIVDDATVALVAGPATSLLVDAPSSATGGSAFNVTVTARDNLGRTDTNYTGTVHFTSTATSATLPSDYTFTGADAGVHTFSVTLGSSGNITLTATDTANASITGNDVVAVKGSTTTALSSSTNPSIVGESVTFTATVTSTTTGTITGSVTFKDGAATLGSGTISSGVATFSTSALTQGTHSITAVYDGSSTFNTSTSSALNQTVNLPPFGPPANVSATATGTSSVAISWSPVSGATSYRIYRTTSVGIAYSQIGTSLGTTFGDSGRSANTTYLYKIASDNGAQISAMSAADAATTIVFTDNALTGIAVKALHVTQLRTAVNAMRTAAGLSAAVFTDPTLTNATRIKRIHLIELRLALDAARSMIGLPAISYTDPTITAGTTKVKAAHWSEVRAGTQ